MNKFIIKDYLSDLTYEGVSNCCYADVLENTERCSSCGENCVVILDNKETEVKLTIKEWKMKNLFSGAGKDQRN